MNPSTINVLMTGAGAPGAAGIIKCLLQHPSIRLTIADADNDAVGKYLHNNFIQIPKANDNSFVDSLVNICKELNIHVVLPLVTKELQPLSSNKRKFADVGAKVIISSPDAIAVGNSKSATYKFLQKNGIGIPQFHVVTNLDEFEIAIKALGFPNNDVCFKPSVSNGSRGFRIITEKIDESELLFKHKPNNTYIRYPDAKRILASKSFPELLVSEYLPGDEYSVDCIANNGEPWLIVPRLRKKMIKGISIKGEFVNDERIFDYCNQIIKVVGLHGNIGIQLKRSASGTPLLLEINPRVQGTIVAALGAGVNLPLLAVKQELGLPISDSEIKVNWGTSFSRYWTEVFY